MKKKNKNNKNKERYRKVYIEGSNEYDESPFSKICTKTKFLIIIITIILFILIIIKIFSTKKTGDDIKSNLILNENNSTNTYNINNKNILNNNDNNDNNINNNIGLNADFDKNFDYMHYEENIITEKMKKDARWYLSVEEASLINGLIRKHKPKNILEVGVARGGSSILILNAIKDFPDSNLYSLDLFEKCYEEEDKKTGYLVEEKFPELKATGKWKLLLGKMNYEFLIELNLKYDFVFLDTTHVSPGEFFNIVEIMPFLNENAIIVLHDVTLQYKKVGYTHLNLYDVKAMPTQIYLMSCLMGEKILMKQNIHGFHNIGAIKLAKNQEQYYLNYFLLMMTVWQEMPPDEQLNGLRGFISKYYHNDLYLRIFDNAVDNNNKFFDNLKHNRYKSCLNNTN